MVKRLAHKTLVSPADFVPTLDNMKVIGAFNPAAVRAENGDIYLLVRVAETCVEARQGHFFSPKFAKAGDGSKLEIECFPIQLNHSGDVRKFLDHEGFMRLAFISHLRVVRLDATGFNVKEIDKHPSFMPSETYEEYGVEDPRFAYIDGVYYFTYVAVSREMGIVTALASTKDFKEFTRHGALFCQENKDVVILPEKIDGYYWAYHRPVAEHQFANPNMHVAKSPDLLHWGDHRLLMATRPGRWDGAKIGGGANPVKTEKGWLEIYHGVEIVGPHDPIGVYKAGAALFDLREPSMCLGRSREPILAPEAEDEKDGFVKNVIFPTGAVLDQDGEHLLLFSGGADTVVTVTKVSLGEIFDSLEVECAALH